MQKLYLLFLIGFYGNLSLAQTNPAPQTLPVNINFGTANFTPPATNMAAWTGDGVRPYTSQAAAEASLSGANTTSVFNTAPASGGSGGQYGHAVSGDARLTILQSGNATNGTTQAALAINTTGVTDATIAYDLALSVANARDIGVVLQYRIGTSGAFTTISGSNVVYNSATSNGGDADGASDLDNYIFNLPPAALGQPEVQIRWATWNGTQAGARSGIGIDNISITAGSILPCSEPANQPTALVLAPAPTSISGSFTAPTPAADGYLVVRSTSPTLSAAPADATVYNEAQSFGGGVIVFIGNTTSFTDLNLSPTTTYYYFVFAFNENACAGGPNYLSVNPLTNSTTTLAIPPCTTPPNPPTNLTLTPTSTSISGSFTGAAGANNYLVVRSLNSTLSFTPANGVTYASGQFFGVDTIVAYGSSTSFFASGLTPSTTYFFFVFSANGSCTGEPFYNTTALTGTAATQAGGGNGIPPGYYDAVGGLTCAPLKSALRNIITAGYISLSYTPGVWNAFQTTDQHPNDAGTAQIMWDMYSDNPAGAEPYTYTYGTNQCGNYNSEGDCYNREHSFPQSWFNSASPMVSDLYHIFPTDGHVNGRRGNQPYGEVSAPTFTSLNGSKLGPNTFPGFAGVVFEPRNEYKGDFARGQLYMITRYETQAAGWQNNGNANDVLAGNTYPSYDNWYIQLLYKWHTNDPVSQKEIDRNNAAYALQNNRNPYVDHPEYVALVFQCTGLIPVTLIDFTATKINASEILLRWYATQETNFKKYQLERSTDGRNFIYAGEVEGRNLSSYSFTDNNLPDATTVFYRIKMIDIDGKFSYSKILAVRLFGSKTNMLVYPNPVSASVSVKLKDALKMPTSFNLTDVAGKTVITQTVNAGQKTVTIDVSNLPAGTYLLHFINDGLPEVEKVQVIR